MNTGSKHLLAAIVAVALAFAIALPLGFWLRSLFPAMSDTVFGTLVAVTLVGIAFGGSKLLGVPMGPAPDWDADRGRRPDPEVRTGYELTFEDFRRLVSKTYSQPSIAPLLKDWYGYEITGEEGTTVIRSADGKTVTLRALYSQIQRDPMKQRRIYNRAMDLWR
jgi:hypothetical protein